MWACFSGSMSSRRTIVKGQRSGWSPLKVTETWDARHWTAFTSVKGGISVVQYEGMELGLV